MNGVSQKESFPLNFSYSKLLKKFSKKSISMFNKEVMAKLNQYLIYWFVWVFFVGAILIYLKVDISNSIISNFLKDIIPVMKILDKTTLYPKLSIGMWTICWVSGTVFFAILFFKFRSALIDELTGSLVLMILFSFFLSIWKIYFGIWKRLPDEHSGVVSQSLHLTHFGSMFDPGLSLILFLYSVIAIVNVVNKSIKA